MSDNEKGSIVIFSVLFAALLAALSVVWVIESAMEARAYNRVTGQNVSTWDAMWIELRVQDSPKK